jgi:cytoskeleton protein RodZ
MTTSSFGEHLKREREMRGVSLDEISAATRISTRFLEALESEQWDKLPGGVFNRGFVRAVARFLGLNEENLVAEYTLATGDRVPAQTWPPGVPPPEVGERSRTFPWLAALLVAVILAGGWVAWRRYVAARSARRAASELVVPSAVPNPPPAPASMRAGETENSSSTTPAGTSASPARPSSAAEPATLHLTVALAEGKATSVKVVADGETVFDGAMESGQSQRFRALEQFEISARDPYALQLELNGQRVVSVTSAGSPGKIRLTRRNLKKPSGGPD